MRYSIFFLTILTVFLTNNFNGQIVDSIDKPVYRHHLGLHLGSTSGRGLSYRYSVDRFAIQLTSGITKNQNDISVNSGLLFLYKLVKTRKANFFVYQSTMYDYRENTFFAYEPITNNQFYTQNQQGWFNYGLGLGIELLIHDRVSLNVMGGYGAYEDFDRITVAGELGVYFKF